MPNPDAFQTCTNKRFLGFRALRGNLCAPMRYKELPGEPGQQIQPHHVAAKAGGGTAGLWAPESGFPSVWPRNHSCTQSTHGLSRPRGWGLGHFWHTRGVHICVHVCTRMHACICVHTWGWRVSPRVWSQGAAIDLGDPQRVLLYG